MISHDQMRFITSETLSLIDKLNASQWDHTPNFDLIKDRPIISRSQLNHTPMRPGLFCVRTSGSTGEPITVQKTIDDQIWLLATNIREYQWRNWDYSKVLAFVKPGEVRKSSPNWGLPRRLAPIQGASHKIGCEKVSDLQAWIKQINPHYLACAPSIRDALDLSNVTNLLDWKGTGERGGTMYSSEECGTIAIQCPDVPSNYHVMENQLVEVSEDGGLIITTLTNPYITRYNHGDHIQLGSCTCGRSLQTITYIYGRVRNMFIMPNGERKWPIFGSRTFYEKYAITRFKLIQTQLDSVTLQYMSDGIRDADRLICEIQELLADVQVVLEPVVAFPDYKFEEFVSIVSPDY